METNWQQNVSTDIGLVLDIVLGIVISIYLCSEQLDCSLTPRQYKSEVFIPRLFFVPFLLLIEKNL